MQNSHSIFVPFILPVCGSPSDLVFVLDASSSIWGPHFRKQLDFVKDVVNNFNIYEDGSGTRIGVVVFSDVEKTKVEFNLNKYYDRKALLAAIGKIRHMTGGTNTHVALKKLREEVFTKQAGKFLFLFNNFTEVSSMQPL